MMPTFSFACASAAVFSATVATPHVNAAAIMSENRDFIFFSPVVIRGMALARHPSHVW